MVAGFGGVQPKLTKKLKKMETKTVVRFFF
jgi:hypothetical protein